MHRASPTPQRTPVSDLAELRQVLAGIRIVEEHPVETGIPRLWSAKAISQRWHMHRLTVYRAHRSGRLPGYRVLGTLRFLEGDVIKLLREEGVPL